LIIRRRKQFSVLQGRKEIGAISHEERVDDLLRKIKKLKKWE
jgi:hypothetical protein